MRESNLVALPITDYTLLVLIVATSFPISLPLFEIKQSLWTPARARGVFGGQIAGKHLIQSSTSTSLISISRNNQLDYFSHSLQMLCL